MKYSLLFANGRKEAGSLSSFGDLNWRIWNDFADKTN
jgi:hypothetical protein